MVVDVGILALGHVDDHVPQLVEGQKHNVDYLRIRHQFTVAHHIQDVLDLVPQVFDLGQPQEAGSAFDGVRRAENLVDEFDIDIRSGLFDGQKIVLDVTEMLGGFFHIHL